MEVMSLKFQTASPNKKIEISPTPIDSTQGIIFLHFHPTPIRHFVFVNIGGT